MKRERKFKPVFWLRLFIITVVSAYAAIIVLGAAFMIVTLTIPRKGPVCCQSPHDFGAEYEDVAFRTADGLALSGWYIPSQNGAVIILVHSYRTNRRQTLPIAKILVRHGYGVLMYDQRATGESEGDMRSFGWLDISDVDRAVAFVYTRPDANKNRIGIYGCSIGAAITVAAVAHNSSIAAVAVDALNSLTFEQVHSRIGDPGWLINSPIFALYFSFMFLRTGALPPTSMNEAIRPIAPRPLLLISAGEGAERARGQELYALAGEPKEYRNIPGAVHCGGPLSHPVEYERYLVNFFDAALLKH